MASGTMRETVVSSPQPAITLQSGSTIDENQNTSHSEKRSNTESQSTKEESNHVVANKPNEDVKKNENFSQHRIHLNNDKLCTCSICYAAFTSQRDLERHMSYHKQKTPYCCTYCNNKFMTNEQLHDHTLQCENKDDDCSNHSEDCLSSNIRIESNISTNLSSPKSSESKSESVESDGSSKAVKSLRSARRHGRKDHGSKRKSDSDSESPVANRRKMKNLNNNDYPDNRFQCPSCDRDFASWNALQLHLESTHPDCEIKCESCNLSFDSPRVLNLHRFMAHNAQEEGKKSESRKKLTFDSPRYRIDRKNLKNVPKVIGFQDINFIDFSSEKFPLVAKDICEKSLHLSKDEFSFDCPHCGRGFPCDSALEIHAETCDSNERRASPKIEKKNKRKSTPKFRPQHSTTSDSDDCLDGMEMNVMDRQRNAFFNSLDLQNTEKPPSLKSDEEPEKKSEKFDSKSDLADIQSIISVTNIPGINVKDFSGLQESKAKTQSDDKTGINLNVHINNNNNNNNNNQSSPGSFSSLSLNSPNFNVLNLISPGYSGSDPTEEEAQDCFAAECRRMKLRGEFPCKLCTAIFPNLRALKGHNRVHISVANGTPNSPYRCNICTYSSLDKATLVRHMRSHNGDRPYECAMCNYAFTTKANCERHLRNRHSKMTRDEVKSSIIYHPSEDPINDSDYQKTSEMNKKNLEKTKEKQEFSLPMNLKINLANLKEKSPKNEDLFQAEHQELIKNIKSEEENKKTETGTMTEDMEADKSGDWQYEDNEEALDLRMNKDKDYESDSSDVPQDLSKKEEVKEYNNNVEEKSVKQEADNYIPQFYDQKPNININSLLKMYSSMYPSLTITQIHQIILTQLNFPGLLQKLHNFPFPPFLMSSPLFSGSNGGFMQKNIQKDLLGLQLSGGNILDEKSQNMTMSEKLQYFQQQALAEIMFKREKNRIASDFYGKASQMDEDVDKQNRINDFIKQNANEYFTESDKKAFSDIILNRREEEKKDAGKHGSADKSNENRNSSVKMVIKNGVLIPKQKQRRYRTERPFSCEHCSARFTLRSNMERHIKQQHPQYWTQKSRSNVGSMRRSDQSALKLNPYNRDYEPVPTSDYVQHYEVGKPVSVLSRDTLNTSGGEVKWESAGRDKSECEKGKMDVVNLSRNEGESEEEEEAKEKEEASVGEEEETRDDLIIDEGKNSEARKSAGDANRMKILINMSEYIKLKQPSSEGGKEREKNSDAGFEDGKEHSKENHPQDLASVSKMLDNAVTQTQAFQKYFQEGARKEEESRREGDDGKKDEGEKSEEEEGLVAGSTSSDDNSYRSESEAPSRSQKKKSAYSLAPNRVSCPYCFRKFPWTSSLRRHVLTHTGQKPFKCTHCPLLFTTKSNCDRHLLRKHGREALIASTGQTDNHESTAGNIASINSHNQTQNGSSSNSYTMRNVPERPYKCNQCPSSTFSTLSNLNKHLSSKHHGQYQRDLSGGDAVSPESRFKNLNPQAPPNVTISPTFPINIPRNLSIIPQYGGESLKTGNKSGLNCKTLPITVPMIRVHEFAGNCNGTDREATPEDSRIFRKRSSSDEVESSDRKRTSPDIARSGNEESPDQDAHKSDLVTIPASELPFKCHLCECSFGERSEALEHIRCQHPNEFQLLVSKGALEANTDEERHQHDDADEVLDSTRGRFPDYANRKVMCAFCLRRFWSAEDLRRHMRTHTGERPFSCDVCQRRFTLKHSMLRHRKKHNTNDEILVGSDEEHHNSFQINHNNNISVTIAPLHKQVDPEETLHRTILHQTLTRCGDSKDDLRQDLRVSDSDITNSSK